ncbi:MAG: hypothetical protein NC336_00340, partial [Clostridium sp.]|nr:hypothetical protein [Clostridium sp.]
MQNITGLFKITTIESQKLLKNITSPSVNKTLKTLKSSKFLKTLKSFRPFRAERKPPGLVSGRAASVEGAVTYFPTFAVSSAW